MSWKIGQGQIHSAKRQGVSQVPIRKERKGEKTLRKKKIQNKQKPLSHSVRVIQNPTRLNQNKTTPTCRMAPRIIFQKEAQGPALATVGGGLPSDVDASDVWSALVWDQ